MEYKFNFCISPRSASFQFFMFCTIFLTIWKSFRIFVSFIPVHSANCSKFFMNIKNNIFFPMKMTSTTNLSISIFKNLNEKLHCFLEFPVKNQKKFDWLNCSLFKTIEKKWLIAFPFRKMSIDLLLRSANVCMTNSLMIEYSCDKSNVWAISRLI